MKTKGETLVEKIENFKIELSIFLLLLASIIFIRSFLEYSFTNSGNFILLSTLHHWTIFYLSTFISSIILISYISNERVERVSKTILIGYSIIILPPIIDHFISNYVFYDYVFNRQLPFLLENWTSLIRTFFTFYQGIKTVMLGQKIEIIFLIILSTIYVYIKTKSVLRTILTPISVYSLIFFYATFPYYFNFGALPESFDSSHNFYSYLYYVSILAILISIQSVIWLRRYNTKIFNILLRHLLKERNLHYLAMVWFGAFLSGADIYTTLLASLCIIFMYQAALGINDIYDVAGDTLSKRSSPLITGTITKQEMVAIVAFCALLSILLATFLSYPAIIIIMLYLSLSVLYSVPPFRVKKYPIISIFTIASEAVLAFALGFFSYLTQQTFPINLAYAMLVCFTLAFNTKDLKDYEGDKVSAIWTIPVLFGLKKGKIIIGALDLVAYFIVPVILGLTNLLLPSLVFGTLTFLVVTKSDYKEWQVFLLYFLFLGIIYILK